MRAGGIQRLMFITRSPVGSYSEKVVKFATQVTLLAGMTMFISERGGPCVEG